MVIQYPHHIYARSAEADSVQDEDGNIVDAPQPQPAESIQDDNGNIIDAEQEPEENGEAGESQESQEETQEETPTAPATWNYVGTCREETNGRGSQVRTNDGRTLVYASLIQMPRGSNRVPEGTEVIISNRILTAEELAGDLEALRLSGTIRAKGRCLNFDAGQLHSRLWI